MIKVDFQHSVNFIDANDIFVGFDMRSQCCEGFGWYIKDNDSIEDAVNQSEKSESYFEDNDMSGWMFDLGYFKQDNDHQANVGYIDVVVFRLRNNNERKFLFLYNIGNGMYGHDFLIGRSEHFYKNREKSENIVIFKEDVV